MFNRAGISRFTMTEPLDKHILVVDVRNIRALIRKLLNYPGYSGTAHDGMDDCKLRNILDMIVSKWICHE